VECIHRLTDIPTHKKTSPPERPFSHYIHLHHLVAEMWTTMKNNVPGKKFFSCSFYLYRFCKYMSYGFPIINFCNPGVHYETPCVCVCVYIYIYIHICVCVYIYIFYRGNEFWSLTFTGKVWCKHTQTFVFLHISNITWDAHTYKTA
jgi:hypothetical protein